MSTLPETNQTPAAPGAASVPEVLEQHVHRLSHDHWIDIAALNAHKKAQDVSKLPTGTALPAVSAVAPKTPEAATKLFSASYLRLYRPLKTFRQRCILFLAVVLSLAAGAPLPIIGVIFGKVINSFPPTEDELRTRIGQLLGVAVAYFVITWGWATAWGVVGEAVSRGLREELLQKAVGMDLGWFEVECPDISQRLTADTQAIQLGTSEKVGLFLVSISYFLAAFTTGFVLNARLTGILFAAAVPAIFCIVTFGSKTVSKYAKQAQEASEGATAVAEGAIHAVQVVQAFDALERLAEEHMAYMRPAVRKGIIKSIVGASMLGLVFFVAYAANALAFWEGARQIASGLRSDGAGTVYTVVFLILDASFVIGQFGPFLQTFAVAAAAGDKILTLLDRPAPEIDVYSTKGFPLPAPAAAQDLKLKNVSFCYPVRPGVTVLDDVSLFLPAGKATAVVGSSGSGKSTLAALLMRFYDPTAGAVTAGGYDLRSLNVRNYRKHIALVDQHPVLFAGTVMENLQHGLLHQPHLSEDEKTARCIQAAKDANADEFINTLPKRFETVIGGGSATALSGGQKARVALARALVGDPGVLVLDEPTAALDSRSEALVLDALERAKAKSDRTIVMIAHRLATVRGADKIVVMGHGKVLEEGTHAELLEKEDGAYCKLVEAQSEGGGKSSDITAVDPTGVITGGEMDEKTVGVETIETQAESNDKTEDAHTYSPTSLICRCVSISAPDTAYIALGLAASFATGALILGEAIIFGNLVSVLNTPSPTMLADARFYALLFFILSLIALCSYTISGSSFGLVSERLIRRLRDSTLRSILRQDAAWFSSSPSHSPQVLLTTLALDSGHLSGLSGVILGTLVSVTTSLCGGIILAHVVAWRIAIVLLAAVPIMLASGFMRLRVLAKFEERQGKAYASAAALATEAVRGIRTVAALGREHDVARLYHDAVEGPYRDSLGFIVKGNFWLAAALAITYFVYALAYYWGAKNVREGYYGQLEFFIVLPALLFSAQASGQMFSLAPEVTRAKSAARSVFRLLDMRPTIDTSGLPPPLPAPTLSSSSLEKGSGSSTPISTPSSTPPTTSLSTTTTTTTTTTTRGAALSFTNICFSYPSRPHHPILSSLTLTIPSGSFTALVGPSGAGKSSLLHLLMRFYDPTSGTVTFNSSPISSIPVRTHRSRLALVPQEPCLFPGSIYFNISLGATPPPSRERVTQVCDLVGMHEFISSLPDGYDARIGASGALLSGGQKQRLAIARALVRDPEVLLLDEATSALDSVSERQVRHAVEVAGKGRTTVAVAHRLATVVHADWIWVLDKGQVVEGGRHEDLINRLGGVYKELWERQRVDQ